MLRQTETVVSEEHLGPFICKLVRVHDKDWGSPFLAQRVYTEDGEYVGDVEHAKWLISKGITFFVQPLEKGQTCCIGFSETDMKWYGWSHRAIYGFGIGSKVSKGDCAYYPSNKEDFVADFISFWTDREGVWRECESTEVICRTDLIAVNHEAVVDDKLGVSIKTRTKFIGADRDFASNYFMPYPDEYGPGEWVAESLEDARQMACDFAANVS